MSFDYVLQDLATRQFLRYISSANQPQHRLLVIAQQRQVRKTMRVNEASHPNQKDDRFSRWAKIMRDKRILATRARTGDLRRYERYRITILRSSKLSYHELDVLRGF